MSVVRSFGADGMPETKLARRNVRLVVFWGGGRKEKEVFEICGRGDQDGTEAGVGRRWIDP